MENKQNQGQIPATNMGGAVNDGVNASASMSQQLTQNVPDSDRLTEVNVVAASDSLTNASNEQNGYVDPVNYAQQMPYVNPQYVAQQTGVASVPESKSYNGLAIASLVVGLCSMFLPGVGLVGGIIAAIIGDIAIRKNVHGGIKTMAMIGAILGIVAAGLTLLMPLIVSLI